MNKQIIEEMARELCGLSIEYETCAMCNSEVKVNCIHKSILTTMTSVVAREIFEEIEKALIQYRKAELSDYQLWLRIADLKMKYESEGTDDESN